MRALLRGNGPEDLLVATDYPLCSQALAAGRTMTLLVLCADALTSEPARQTALECLAVSEQTIVVEEQVFVTLQQKDRHTGMLAVVHQPLRVWDGAVDVPPLTLILDGIEQAGNAGSLLRSADGAGVGRVVYTGRRVRLNHPALVMASRGACFHLPQYVCGREELAAWLDCHGIALAVADPYGSVRYDQPAYPVPTAVLVGNERDGVEPFWKERARFMVSIPMRGHCDSLNVAVAATLVLYQAAQTQRHGL